MFKCKMKKNIKLFFIKNVKLKKSEKDLKKNIKKSTKIKNNVKRIQTNVVMFKNC